MCLTRPSVQCDLEIPETTVVLKSKLPDYANTAFKTSPSWSNCRRVANVYEQYLQNCLGFFLFLFFHFFADIVPHINYVSNAWDGCACVHMKQLYTLHKRAKKFLMPSPNMDYNQKCCALKLLPLDKQLLLNKCVLMQKVVHGKAPQYLKDLMIPSQRLHLHSNKQLLPKQGSISLKRVSPFRPL